MKKDGKVIKGMYIDEGTFTEMNAEKDKYDRGEKKIPKKIKNPIVSHLFDTVTHLCE